ncbi:MAG: hypothetical protein ACRDGG_03945 [Anaerolineae bacterium]
MCKLTVCHHPMNKWSRGLPLIAFMPLAFLFMINVHEIGHTVFAQLLGDRAATYHLYERYPSGGFCLGCNTYDHNQLSTWGNLLTAAGGVLFTQAVAIAVLLLRRTRVKNSAARRLTAILAVVFVLDMPLQVLQAFRIDVADQPYPTQVDLVDFTRLISGETNMSASAIQIAVLGVLIVYVLWIVRLYRVRHKL